MANPIPYQFPAPITALATDPAKQMSTDPTIQGKMLMATVYPFDPAVWDGVVYVGLDSSVSATRCVMALRAGDVLVRTAALHEWVRPFDYWFKVSLDGGGFVYGLE